MSKYTIKNLRTDINYVNHAKVENFLPYYFREQGRNGYQAVDLYMVRPDGIHSCERMVCGGSSRECYVEMNCESFKLKYSEKLTRIQAFEMLKLYGIDFNADFHTQAFEYIDLLHDWAKKTGYRKPKNANGSLARYFFEHLVRRFVS